MIAAQRILSWASLMRKSVGAVEGVEGPAEVVGDGVGSGDGLPSGLGLYRAVAAGAGHHRLRRGTAGFTASEAVAYDMADEVIGGPSGAPESGTSA